MNRIMTLITSSNILHNLIILNAEKVYCFELKYQTFRKKSSIEYLHLKIAYNLIWIVVQPVFREQYANT